MELHSSRISYSLNRKLDYLFSLPLQYNSEGSDWPLILFLHGAGERGDDLRLLKKHGIPKVVDEMTDFPFITVSPQCPENDW